MFVVGDSSSGEGTSEDNPIVLEGYKADDFEASLKVLYPTWVFLSERRWLIKRRLTSPLFQD
jgi:hypothetical protein